MLNWKNILFSWSLGYLYYKYKQFEKKKLLINKDYFNGKNIIISGSSSGIGKSLADILSKMNCNLYLLARSFENRISDNVYKYKCDCSNYENIFNVVNDIKDNCNNQIDLIINCAGSGDWKFFNEMNIEQIDKCLAAPLKSAINLVHTTLPDLIKNNKGQIVFVQSPVIIQPWASCTAYSISRWGMRGLSESLRADLYNTNILISEIILGKTNSNYFITNKSANKRFPKIGNLIGSISPNQAAFAILWAIQNKNQYYYYPFMMKIVIYLQYLFPGIVRFLTFKTSWYS